MSADNWAECPRCKQLRDEEIKELVKKQEESYGKLPKEDYEQLNIKIQELKDMEFESTVREDYEQGIKNDGNAYFYYSASCNSCGFGKDIAFDEEKHLIVPLGKANKNG